MLRGLMIVGVVLHLLFTGLTALVGAFADGGSFLERVQVSLIHPGAAVLLLVAVVTVRSASRGFLGFTLVVLVIGIAGDVLLAVLLGLGVLKGDWVLPLVFAVIPAIGIAYLRPGHLAADRQGDGS